MRILPAALLLVALWCAPAAAYDPDARTSSDPTDAQRQEPARAAPKSDPREEASREGLHQVNEVYSGDRVTRSGDETIYSTDTEHRTIDTYAKAVDVVRTGERSAFDGTSFNGRGAISTGEAVGGTYYEDYVWTGDRFVRVNVVFFQDDSELARRTGRDRPAPLPPESGPIDTRPQPVAPPPPSERELPGDTPTPTVLRIGVDPTGGPALLDLLEVARGAPYLLRVNARGTPEIALEAWQLVGGVDDSWNAAGWHAASEPLAGSWLRMPRPGSTWTLALLVRVHRVAGGAAFEAQGAIQIVVRSPAVVE